MKQFKSMNMECMPALNLYIAEYSIYHLLPLLIKNVLTRRKESNTYLTTVSRHRWSLQIAIKWIKCVAFSRHCGFHQLKRKLMKAAVPAESYTLYPLYRDLRTPAMSTDSSQVGVTLFSSC